MRGDWLAQLKLRAKIRAPGASLLLDVEIFHGSLSWMNARQALQKARADLAKKPRPSLQADRAQICGMNAARKKLSESGAARTATF